MNFAQVSLLAAKPVLPNSGNPLPTADSRGRWWIFRSRKEGGVRRSDGFAAAEARTKEARAVGVRCQYWLRQYRAEKTGAKETELERRNEISNKREFAPKNQIRDNHRDANCRISDNSESE